MNDSTWFPTFANLRKMFYLVSPSESTFERLDRVPSYANEVIGWVFIFMVAEVFALRLQGKRKSVALNDSITSTGGMMYKQLMYTAIGKSVDITFYGYVYREWRVVLLPPTAASTWLLCFLTTDFLYYMAHRAMHEVAILWSFHQMHHSSEYYNFSTALRQSAYQNLSTFGFECTQALAIPPPIFLVHKYLNSIYQFWIHTETIPALGPLEYVINTPSHHRVHHGNNPYCIDKNYGGTLIIWDRIFGTFEPERAAEPPQYGLVRDVNSFDPLYCQHFSLKSVLFTKPKQLKLSIMDRLRCIFCPPAWTPSNRVAFFLFDFWHRMVHTNEPEAVGKQVDADKKKHNPHISTALKMYVVLHFVVMLVQYAHLTNDQKRFDLDVTFASCSLPVTGSTVLRGIEMHCRLHMDGSLAAVETFYADCSSSLDVCVFFFDDDSFVTNGEHYHNLIFMESLWRPAVAYVVGVVVAAAGNMLSLAILRYVSIVRVFESLPEHVWTMTRHCLAVTWLAALSWAVLGAAGAVFAPTYDQASGRYTGAVALPLANVAALTVFTSAVACLGLYGACFRKISRSKKQLAESQAVNIQKTREAIELEYRILIQSVYLCSAQIFVTLMYSDIFVAIFGSYELQYMMNYVGIIINYGSNPFLYLIFSSELRRLAIGACFPNKNQVTPF